MRLTLKYRFPSYSHLTSISKAFRSSEESNDIIKCALNTGCFLSEKWIKKWKESGRAKALLHRMYKRSQISIVKPRDVSKQI